MASHPDPRVDEVLSRFDVQLEDTTLEAVVDALRGPGMVPSGGRFVEALLRPAFSAEILVVVHERSVGTMLWVSTAQTNLARWKFDSQRPAHVPEARPALLSSTAWLDGPTADGLWASAGKVIQPDTPRVGLDGVEVDLRIRIAGPAISVHTRCSSQTSAVGVLLAGIGRLVMAMPEPFPTIMSATGVLKPDSGPPATKEYVGYVWVDDNPGERVKLSAASLTNARARLRSRYGPNHTHFLWNEDDRRRPRG